MNVRGSFYPLVADGEIAEPVLFAFAVNTPLQRQALHQEALARLSAASALSDALTTVRIEAHDDRSHAPFLEAIAILSRDARGLLVALGEVG